MTQKEKALMRIDKINTLSMNVSSLAAKNKDRYKGTPKLVRLSLCEIELLSSKIKEVLREIKADYKSTDQFISRVSAEPYDIMSLIKDEFHIDVTVKTRETKFREARHITCYLFRNFTALPLKDIAPYVGLTDHTSVIHAIKKVNDYAYTNITYRNNLKKIEDKLTEQINNK